MEIGLPPLMLLVAHIAVGIGGVVITPEPDPAAIMPSPGSDCPTAMFDRADGAICPTVTMVKFPPSGLHPIRYHPAGILTARPVVSRRPVVAPSTVSCHNISSGISEASAVHTKRRNTVAAAAVVMRERAAVSVMSWGLTPGCST